MVRTGFPSATLFATVLHFPALCLSLAGGFILTGCGSGRNPPEDCRAVTRSWCNASMNCLVEVGSLTRDEADDAEENCVERSESRSSCDDAKAVTEDFPACMQSLGHLDCGMFDVPSEELGSVKLPEVCQAVILR